MAEHISEEGAQALLIRELQRVHRLHDERTSNPILAGALDRLADWQARRLRMTYADLAADPRYTAAIVFFQNDLYGSVDYSRRDADLARVVPMMVKVLPESVIATIAAAMAKSSRKAPQPSVIWRSNGSVAGRRRSRSPSTSRAW